MKKTLCDNCKEPIEMKEGELFQLEIEKITEGFDQYPYNISSNVILSKDLCKKCKTKIVRIINKGVK